MTINNYVLTRPFMNIAAGTILTKQVRDRSAYFKTRNGEIIYFAGEQKKYVKPAPKTDDDSSSLISKLFS